MWDVPKLTEQIYSYDQSRNSEATSHSILLADGWE